MSQRQRSVALECGQHDIGTHTVYAGNAHQLFHDKRRQRVQVRRDDSQQLIGVANRRMAFEHFGQRFDLLLELVYNGIAVMFQLEARESGHAEP